MFGKPKISGSIELRLNEEQFCTVWEGRAEECSHDFCVDTNADQYNLFYRNGQFFGMPTPFGGTIYPFSDDPTKKGTRHQKRGYNRARVVCLSKDFNLKVFWGTRTPFLMLDNTTGEPYSVGASGVFYVNIDPSDAARNGDRFYHKLLTQGDPSQMNTEALRDKLAEAFLNRVGAKIQEYLEQLNRPLSNLVGLQPSEFLKISEELYPKMKDIFADYGLTIVKASSGSILGRLIVNPAQ
ncbi:MAG: hypothetical protein E7645_04975 [Ruminococcaceae bacterium]|nr:hypothetical protein [Oscillospiraceae bacterium]